MAMTAERLAYLLYKLSAQPGKLNPTEADYQETWKRECQQHWEKDEWLRKANLILQWAHEPETDEQIEQDALNALAEAGLGSDTPSDAFIVGYRAGRQAI